MSGRVYRFEFHRSLTVQMSTRVREAAHELRLKDTRPRLGLSEAIMQTHVQRLLDRTFMVSPKLVQAARLFDFSIATRIVCR